MILSGSFFAFVNGKNTGIKFTGKFNYLKRVIRFTNSHYQKHKDEAVRTAIKNNILTKENYESGYYDFYFEDEDHNKYVWYYRAGGLSNNLDNGYFYKIK